jgi:ComF family protein
MRKLLTALFDIVFPPDSDELVVRSLSPESVRSLYREHANRDWAACSPFKHEHIRALIHETKYGRNADAQKLLALLLIEYMTRHKQARKALWMPIPLSPARMRARGYNQVLEVLKLVNEIEPIMILSDTLERTRDTRPQTELSREGRLSNMRGAFSVVKPDTITDKDIIIIDDVVTTGATLREAKAVLLPYHPRSIALLALAH